MYYIIKELCTCSISSALSPKHFERKRLHPRLQSTRLLFVMLHKRQTYFPAVHVCPFLSCFPSLLIVVCLLLFSGECQWEVIQKSYNSLTLVLKPELMNDIVVWLWQKVHTHVLVRGKLFELMCAKKRQKERRKGSRHGAAWAFIVFWMD